MSKIIRKTTQKHLNDNITCMYRDEHLRAIDNALLRVKDKIEQKIKEEAARVKLLSIRGL